MPLCQPDGTKSCGACCGLYNWQDHSRGALHTLLQTRTSSFFSADPEKDFLPPRQGAGAPAANAPLLETIHNCKYLGFIDRCQKRVGCLLHPSLHQGRDMRGKSFYGEELCADHLCPSHTHLTEVEQSAAIHSLQDWYLYGLVITDIDLIKEFFRHVQDRLGDCLRGERLKVFDVRMALKEFFQLKEFWKFASSQNRLGKYYFSHAEYQVSRIEYEKGWGTQPSPFDKILVSLSSEFQSRQELAEAESIIEAKIARFIKAYLKN